MSTTNYQSYKDRKIDFGKRVQIYKNLHKGMYSVKQNGKVVAHLDDFILDRPSFIVSEQGRQRVIAEKVKNVHAVVGGFLLSVNGLTDSEFQKVKLAKLSYNPYKSDKFYMCVTDKKHIHLENNVIHFMQIVTHNGTLFIKD